MPPIIINDKLAVQLGICNAIKYFLNKIEQKKINKLCREN